MPCNFSHNISRTSKKLTYCVYISGMVIDQTRKDGFRFRNVDEGSHPSANANTFYEDPRVDNVREIGEKETFEDPEKDKVQALVLDG